MDDSQPKTLYVGNLDASVSEDLLCALFGQIGTVKSCKIIREGVNDPYAFIEFANHQSATTALTAMNKRVLNKKEMKVNWATSPGNQPKTDTSTHHHIFVGDLSPEIETETLREAFAPFGEISNCRIVRDSQTLKSKGYAFVSFVKKAEAENAIQAMNGIWLGSRSIRTNWSTRKPPAPREGMGVKGLKSIRPTYEEVYNQTSPTNTTVYCGGFPQNSINEDIIHKHFSQFGTIQDIRVFKDKGYAFIKFTSKESATIAIENTHNTEVNGVTVKCFWGKENGGDMNNSQPAGLVNSMVGGGGGCAGGAGVQQAQQQGTQYQQYSYQQMGAYWYPQQVGAGYPQMQAAQYAAMQQQGYGYSPYATAYANPQQGAAAYRMVQQNVAWGVQSPTAANAPVPGMPNSNTGQPQMMYTAMPQYQTQ